MGNGQGDYDKIKILEINEIKIGMNFLFYEAIYKINWIFKKNKIR